MRALASASLFNADADARSVGADRSDRKKRLEGVLDSKATPLIRPRGLLPLFYASEQARESVWIATRWPMQRKSGSTNHGVDEGRSAGRTARDRYGIQGPPR